MKNRIFARFARAFFIFWHFEDDLVLSTMWNDLFCSCVDDVSIWWQMFNFVFLCPKRWFKINSRTVRRHFSGIMTLNNCKLIAKAKRSYIFRWRSRFRRRLVCLSSLITLRFYDSPDSKIVGVRIFVMLFQKKKKKQKKKKTPIPLILRCNHKKLEFFLQTLWERSRY